MKNTFKLILALLIASTATLGCTEIDPSSASSSSVSGQLSPDHERAGEGSQQQAHAYRIEDTGELIQIASASVDAQSKFQLDLSAEAGQDLLLAIEDETSGRLGAVLVESTGDMSLTSVPIDSETTFEADVFVELRASGQWDDSSMSQSYIRSQIEARTAAEAEASADYEATVRETASAMAESMMAFKARLEYEAQAEVAARMEQAHAALLEAQQAFDARIASRGESTVQAADEAFARAYFEAYVEAGFTAEAVAEAVVAAQASAEAQGEATVDAGERSMELFKAQLVGFANEAQLRAAGLTESAVQASIDAHAQLMLSLEAAYSSGTESAEAVAQAWTDYRAQIEAELEASASIAETLLTELVAESEEAVASFEAAASEAASGEAVAQAMVSARAELVSEANLGLLTLAGQSSAEAEATLEVIALLAFCSP